jgi:hypothetical protein
MSVATKEEQDATEEKREKFERARKSLNEMEETIAPFTKRRKFEQHSTAGRWRDASDYERSDFFRDLKKVVRKQDWPPDRDE